ncbi:uncharacterized protein NECHADRAFT_44681, partial [Fusarium vanettenii 77-13-4]
CNGGRPRCDACERLGFECLYEQQEASANLLVPKDLFAALETRVKLLETKLELQNGRLAARRTDDVHQDSLACRSSDVIVNIEGCHDSSIDQSMTDGMAVSFVDEQDCGFFGPSSNIAFMRHILRAIKKRQSAHRRLSSQASASEFGTYEGGVRFRASGFRTNVRRTWLGLLNMIFAMATCTSCWEESGSDYRFEQSDVYYRRARELCQTQMFRGTTLEIGKTITLDQCSSERHLYRIMGRIITTLYGSNLGCDEQPTETVTMTSIIQFGQELTEWQHNLPPQLALRSSTDLPKEGEIQDSTTERVRLILTLRYLNVQLLLHRPTFIRSLGALLRDPMTSTRNPAPVNHMQSSFDRTFVQVAENIIEIIYTVLTRPDLGRHLIGAWWFTLYYAFSAALAIFGSLVIFQDNDVEGVHDTDRLERAKRSLTQASEALLRMGTENMIISRCVDFLQQLLRAVNAWGKSTILLKRCLENGNFDLESDLFSTMPAFDASAVGLGDDIELGHFFAADFQRWFERNHW